MRESKTTYYLFCPNNGKVFVWIRSQWLLSINYLIVFSRAVVWAPGLGSLIWSRTLSLRKKCFWGWSLQDRLLGLHQGLSRLGFTGTFCFVLEENADNKETSFYRHCFLCFSIVLILRIFRQRKGHCQKKIVFTIAEYSSCTRVSEIFNYSLVF